MNSFYNWKTSRVGGVGLTSHSTYNGLFRKWVFPGSQLHWYWHREQTK